MLAVVCLVLAGCSTPDVGYFYKLADQGRFGTAPKSLKEEAMSRARQQYPRSSEKQEKFVYSYYEGYESGLMCIHGTHTSGDEHGPHNLGLQAGRTAAITDLQAGRPKVTLRDFGYVEINSKGKLKLEFENQEFLPEDSGDRWWVVYNPVVENCYAAALGKQDERRWHPPHVFAHLRGYLSPDRESGVGHFNQYDREFVVTNIVEIRRLDKGPNNGTEPIR